jgi:hypothetical protein
MLNCWLSCYIFFNVSPFLTFVFIYLPYSWGRDLLLNRENQTAQSGEKSGFCFVYWKILSYKPKLYVFHFHVIQWHFVFKAWQDMEQHFVLRLNRFYPYFLGYYSFYFGSLGGHFAYHEGNHWLRLAQLMSMFFFLEKLKTNSERFVIFGQRESDNFLTRLSEQC